MTKFSVAVSRRIHTPSETREETQWFTIIAWSRLAEICNEHLTKGKKVFIEGRLRLSTYTDREGIRRTAIEVIAHEMEMLSPKQQKDEEEQEQKGEEGEEDIEALIEALEQQEES